MRILTPALLALLLSPTVSAQGPDVVVNGDFSAGLAPWVLGGGYSVNPGVESGVDVTGLGASDSFGCQAGGQVTPAPYPPNTIEQTVQVIAGLTYEFRMDAFGTRYNTTTGNADTGTIWATLDGVEVARIAFGGWANPEQKRAQVCGRIVPLNSGNVQLVIFFQRAFLANTSTPRVNVDNVSLREVPGPTFCVRGNRRLGRNIDFVVEGAAGAPYAGFVASGLLPAGFPIFPFSGELWLDPTANLIQFIGGTLDANGIGSTTFAIPSEPALLVVPLSYQALATLPPTFGFSLPTTLVMTN
jgi:hypothetical protein